MRQSIEATAPFFLLDGVHKKEGEKYCRTHKPGFTEELIQNGPRSSRGKGKRHKREAPLQMVTREWGGRGVLSYLQ